MNLAEAKQILRLFRNSYWREVVTAFDTQEVSDALDKVIETCEFLLSVKGMPEKKQVRYEHTDRVMDLNGKERGYKQQITYSKEDEAFNEAVDLCTAAAVANLLTKEEYKEILKRTIGKNEEAQDQYFDHCTDEICAAQSKKMMGEK